MIVKRIGTVVLCGLVLVFGFSAAESESDEVDKNRPTLVVSLVELITQPDKHKGDIIQTTGYMQYGGDLMLFLTSEHARLSDTVSAVSVYQSDERITRCSGKFVVVVGEYDWNPLAKEHEIVRPIEVRQRSSTDLQQTVCWRSTGK